MISMSDQYNDLPYQNSEVAENSGLLNCEMFRLVQRGISWTEMHASRSNHAGFKPGSIRAHTVIMSSHIILNTAPSWLVQ